MARKHIIPQEATLLFHGVAQVLTVHRTKALYNFLYIDKRTGETLGTLLFGPSLSYWPIPTDAATGWLFAPCNALNFHVLLPQLEGAMLRAEFLRITNDLEDLL